MLQDLQGRIARQRVDDLELLRNLLRHEPGCLAERLQLVERQRRHARPHLDDGTHTLAPRRIRKADDRHRRNPRMGHQHVLDLAGADVLALADDHVLAAAGQHEMAVGAQVAAVAGLEEAVLAERRGGQLRIEVALRHHRPAHHHLAVHVREQPLPVAVFDRDLAAEDRRAFGVRELLVRHRRSGRS